MVAALVSRIARRKRAAFLYHKQDIYPEVTVTPQRPLGLVGRGLRRVDTRTDLAASRVIVLSRDMAKTLGARGVDGRQVRVINNFDPWPVELTQQTRGVRDAGSDLEVAFAGNLGRFQGLETMFDAVELLRDEPIRFHFFGEGPLVADLHSRIRSASLTNVEVHGYRPPAEVANFLAERADLGVVSLTPGVIRAAYPSKTLSYLRQGTPILALVEGSSELSDMVVSRHLGLQVEPGDVGGLVDALRGAASDPHALHGAPERLRELYAREYSREARLSQWSALFDEVTQ